MTRHRERIRKWTSDLIRRHHVLKRDLYFV